MGIEYVVDPQVERLCQLESQRQRRIVFAGFDSVYGLPGNANVLAKISLAPPALGTKDAKPILHLERHIRRP